MLYMSPLPRGSRAKGGWHGFDPHAGPRRIVMTDDVKTYAFRDLLNHPRKPDTDAIVEEGILKKNSLMVIGGPPKSYKSFISNTIAIDLVVGRHLFTAMRSDHGRHVHAFDVRAPQKVLIFEQEIGEDDIEDRIKPIYEILSPEHQ